MTRICSWAFALLLSLFSLPLLAQAQPAAGSTYRFTLDLAQVKNDQVQVTLLPPAIKQTEVVYNIPKIVPGTYTVYDFGKFVSDFKALDKAGKELPVKRLDPNRWQISGANRMARITYRVDDTFDTPEREDFVFEPGGTNIQADTNFLINTHGFIGYFDGLKHMPYHLTFTKPEGFYGASALRATARTATTETYTLSSYMEVADSPLMFTRPDTTSLKIGQTDVLVSVYSPSEKVGSKIVAENIRQILEGARVYLGGELPVDKYAFLVYLDNKPNRTGAYGALEHSYSSVYYLPETGAEEVAEQIRSIAAHEFFHILTPLTVHAEQIHDFDFNNPQMSEHLWLYEGVTEYFSTHMQVNQKLITAEEYLKELREYLVGSRGFNDTLPFTQMSAQVLGKHKDQYGNVYAKGALIGLVLDIKLRQLSDGKYGLRSLLADLARQYGKDKAFKDEELFDQIARLTYPQIREFFTRYVEGPELLPLSETLNLVGVNYDRLRTEMKPTFGKVQLSVNPKTQAITVISTDRINEFGRKMGYQKGDQLLQINKEEVTIANGVQLMNKHFLEAKPGTPVTVLVLRKDKNGRDKKVLLKGNITLAEAEVQDAIDFNPSPTPGQQRLRQAWLFGEG